MSNPHPKPRAVPVQSDPSTPIGRMAAEIARLNRLDDLIHAAKAHLAPGHDLDEEAMGREAYEAALETLPKAECLPDGRMRYGFFEHIMLEIEDRREALELAISIEEAQSVEDLVTLSIIYRETVDIVSERSEETTEGDPLRRIQGAKEDRRVRRVGDALVRGLRKYAKDSPLIGHYLNETWNLRSWGEELALAEAEVAKLPVLVAE